MVAQWDQTLLRCCIRTCEALAKARLCVFNMTNRSLTLMELQGVGGDGQGITAIII